MLQVSSYELSLDEQESTKKKNPHRLHVKIRVVHGQNLNTRRDDGMGDSGFISFDIVNKRFKIAFFLL